MIQLKVFLHLGNEEKAEVRMFAIDQALAESFHYLNTKLCEIFPILKEKNYKVSWKDSEDDEITVTSDDELKIALMSMRMIKFHVTCKDGNKTESHPNVPDSGEEKALHCGVICDGCEGEVFGFRYKCTSCLDFDLCSRCEAAGMHPEHCMVRVPAANLPRDLVRNSIKRSRQFLRTVVGNESSPHKKNRHERRHRGSGDCRRPTWFETFSSYMNEFADLTGDIASAANESKPKPSAPTKNTTEKQSENTNETEQHVTHLQQMIHELMQQMEATAPNKTPPPSDGNKAQKDTEPSNQSESAGVTSGEHFNKVCLNIIEKVLNPAAHKAEASANVNNDNKESESSGKEPDTPNTTPQNCEPSTSNTENVLQKTMSRILHELNGDFANHKDDKVAETDNKEKEGSPSSEGAMSIDSDSSMKAQGKEQDKSDGWTMINKDLMDMLSAEASAPPEHPQPIGFKQLHHELEQQLKFEDRIYPPLNINAAVFNPRAPENTPPQGRAAPVAATSGAIPKTRPTEPPKPSQKPQKENPPEPQPTNQLRPHVTHALGQMLAMGFSNDGGWLSQLLESKDGNIASVLDLLTPVRPEKP